MNDTQITLTGWVGGEVQVREAAGVAVANLRVGCTPRRFDRKSEQWVDGDTQWYAVTAWRQLAENCGKSLRRGDPVVIHGRMIAETWTNSSGVGVTAMKVEATFIGHDLNRGVSHFEKLTRAESGAPSVTGVEDEGGDGGARAVAPAA